MKQIAVLGEEKFNLGFQIAGINKAFSLSKEHPEQTIRELMDNEEIGLIIVQHELLERFNETLQEKIQQSIEPVFLVISEQDSNEELRKLIKKSIGVDVWDQ